jgi:hypothetical protein
MAHIIRDGEIVPIAIPLGKRVKIGSAYEPPLENYVANDQPWYAIKNRFEKYLVGFAIWGTLVYALAMIGRYFLGAPA